MDIKLSLADVDIFMSAFRTGAKIGLYPPIMDALGQYPPQYGIPKAADLATYIYLNKSTRDMKSHDGLIEQRPFRVHEGELDRLFGMSQQEKMYNDESGKYKIKEKIAQILDQK